MTSQDGSAQGLVIARLFRVPRCSGTPILVCLVQSTDAVAGPTCTQCTFGASPDFVNNSYYVEVTITRNTAAVTPVLFNLGCSKRVSRKSGASPPGDKSPGYKGSAP